ncbi:MAG: ATP-binding cassette domain-containing protein, partial [Pseudanabaenales cyanobacterium]|nr:ATP-binding cassette domain-containing protein [Pseudanabaenales cyanobacterium]
QQYAPIYKLSGGEKRRLFLLKVLMSAPNVLILDEPTNDLDVQTLAVLEEYLENFNGCAIAVSHDRYFLDRTVDTIFALEPGGTLRQYPGNYSVYLDYKQAEASKEKRQESDVRSREKPARSPSVQVPSSTRPRKLSYKEKREFERLEQDIPAMETEKAEIEKTLYHTPPSGFTQLQQMTERLADLNTAIDQATERWMELAELDA